MSPSSGILKSFVVSKPATAFTASSAALGFFALTPTPPLIPVALLIAIVRLSAWTFAPRQGGYTKGALQALAIAAASGAAHLAPGLDATSTPQAAFVVLATIALGASAFAVALVFAGVRFGRAGASHWTRLTVFPALWASGWASMAQVTGVGQLVTWSPVTGQGPYVWMRHLFGQWGVDWVTAAWAVVISEVLGDWLMDAPHHDEDALVDTDPLLVDHPHPEYGTVPHSSSKASTPLSRSRSLLVLTSLLLLLMLPSYTSPQTPLPYVASDDITNLRVACALPTPCSGNPTLDDYIYETKQLQAYANIILWPESAVRFESPAERDAAFAAIQNKSGATNKKLIGVSFEEYVPAEAVGQPGHRYNGFALLPLNGTPVMTYYKRNLVPITESFSLTPGTEPPSVFTIELDRPKGIQGPKKRPVPITASICLDFASTSSFTPLESRPALILAPGKTWHSSVGLAMWEQAKARAAETGASVLWCDGGRGGLSGIASPRYSEIVQVGPGSWTKQLGVPYPFDTRRTFYERGGQRMAFAAVWLVIAAGAAIEGAVAALERSGVSAGTVVQAVLRKVRPGRESEHPEF